MRWEPASIGGILEPLMPLIYLAALGAVFSLIFSLVDMFSVDRVLKRVSGRRAFVFVGDEAHFGRIETPPRSKGGFEVFYGEDGIENPESLVAFLVENYRETGNRRFLEKAGVVLDRLKEIGLVPEDRTLEDVTVDSWAPPSLVSRKVYPGELGNLKMIIAFVDLMTEEEKRRRWREFSDLYGRSFLKRAKRRVYNALSYVKDRLAASVVSSTGALTSALPEDLRKAVEEAEKEAVGAAVGQTYDPLLENSVGRLVAVRVDDVDGERKLYQGVLGEYSDRYVYLLDVDYRLQVLARVRGDEVGEVRSVIRFFGERVPLEGRLSIERVGDAVRIANAWDRPLKVERLTFEGGEAEVGRVLGPGGWVEVEGIPEEFEVHYEVALESDVIWPRSRAVVVGLGDYPPRVLESVLGVRVRV